jgi:hypothetical protein
VLGAQGRLLDRDRPPGGGHFYIRVADTMEGDVGTVRDWAVHVSSDEAAEIATRR